MIIFNSIVKDPSFNSSILLSCTIILYFGCAVRSTVLPTMFYSNKKICICIFFCAARRYLLILHPMNKIPNLLNGVIRAMSIWTFSLHSLLGVRKQLPWYSFFFLVLPKWPIRENWTCNASVVCQNTLIMELCHATQLIVLFHCSKCSETFVLIHAASAINAFIKISCICHLNEMMLLY